MNTPIEAIIYDLAPPLKLSRTRPDATKIFARWQSGLETLSGHCQWKVRLELASLKSAAIRDAQTCEQNYRSNHTPPSAPAHAARY
jgi:hypothetical protein